MTVAEQAVHVEAGQKHKEFKIVVNGVLAELDHELVTYEEVVAIGFPGHHDPGLSYSVTYRKAAQAPHSGSLAAGGSVKVMHEGTSFSATPTTRS